MHLLQHCWLLKHRLVVPIGVALRFALSTQASIACNRACDVLCQSSCRPLAGGNSCRMWVASADGACAAALSCATQRGHFYHQCVLAVAHLRELPSEHLEALPASVSAVLCQTCASLLAGCCCHSYWLRVAPPVGLLAVLLHCHVRCECRSGRVTVWPGCTA